ncbi:MAG: histidine kinase [Arthrobacter sp.]|nr:histidine kinase [Arthrobacter sp.]
MRFSTQTLLLQLSVVILVVLFSAAVHAWLTYDRVGSEAENQALTLARTVASDASVRADVLAISQQPGTPPAAELAAGPLMEAAEAARTRTGALFVVITDETGLRLAHPDPERLGEKVSTDPSEALAGREVTTRNTGTLGPSAGAKVPVYAPDGTTVVGEVSVGYSMETVGQSVARDIGPVALTAAGALLAGVLGSFLLRRRLTRLTLGLEPEEISTLVHDQVAVLQGVDDGVVGVSADGRITVFNAAAQRLLDLPDLAGSRWEDAPVPDQVKSLTRAGSNSPEALELVAGGRVLVANARKALHRREDLGWVVMLRDRTELQQLTRQLDAVGTMSTALRAQRHEFANQLHTISGLLQLGEPDEAASLIGTLTRRQAEISDAVRSRVADPAVAALLVAKVSLASERRVSLTLDPGSSLPRLHPGLSADVLTVLGNLVDNAVESTAEQVVVRLSTEDGGPGPRVVVVQVADTGPGVPPEHVPDLFRRGYSTKPADASGRGVGLALVQLVCERRGGSVSVHNDAGAVFTARLVDTWEEQS